MALSSNWLRAGSDINSDFNIDAVVNARDLGIVMSSWRDGLSAQISDSFPYTHIKTMQIDYISSFTIGTLPHTVIGREFDNARVLFKLLPIYYATTADATATSHTLPVTTDNPTGQYYVLNSDGMLNATPVTEISLRNTDGAILIKKTKVQ